ncbi:MAG TPA: lycopene cyclase family protein [Chitinophagaceae bacterium]|nr:lycopene cyclase family protein [Chitinophagaceae bacterium]
MSPESPEIKRMERFDYVFLGAGCAALSLVMRMISCGKFRDKKILLVDKAPKNKNDRTWCFWEKGKGFFEEIICREWETISYKSNEFSASLNIAPYRYKMIRSIDFYNYCFGEITRHDNIKILYGELKTWDYHKNGLTICIDDYRLELPKATVFNSIFEKADIKKGSITLLQHFKGWVIKTNEQFFKNEPATLMDFRVHQEHGTSFAYILPFDDDTALVEFTLMTKSVLEQDQYDKELRHYIEQVLKIPEYEIKEQEFGIIPMTNHRFSFAGKGWNIGTAGGQTKASSGYSFQFIQKQSIQILDYLLSSKPLGQMPSTPWRFRFYDNTLLHILYHNQLPASTVFSRLFQKNKPSQVLRFLDNESTLSEELKIISTLPVLPFLKAAMRGGRLIG